MDVICPNCDENIEVVLEESDDLRKGVTVKCPECRKQFVLNVDSKRHRWLLSLFSISLGILSLISLSDSDYAAVSLVLGIFSAISFIVTWAFWNKILINISLKNVITRLILGLSILAWIIGVIFVFGALADHGDAEDYISAMLCAFVPSFALLLTHIYMSALKKEQAPMGVAEPTEKDVVCSYFTKTKNYCKAIESTVTTKRVNNYCLDNWDDCEYFKSAKGLLPKTKEAKEDAEIEVGEIKVGGIKVRANKEKTD